MKDFSFKNWAMTAALLLTLTTVDASAQEPGNPVTTVADMGTSGMYVATLTPDHDVAIDSQGEEVTAFCIYLDDGLPYVLKMRVQGGKYVVKAGECCVLKTMQPMTLTLESPKTSRSSLWLNDAICPTEDTPVEDFRANHPVAEGEYIYMLTNMEKNGGFGFTYFTGSTMKKGNFYIVSTREPETTGIQTVKLNVASVDGAVYNLQGIRVSNPAEGQIYIQNGRKFVKRSNAISMPSQEQPSTVIPVMTRADKDIEDGDPVPFLSGEAGDEDGF